MPIIKQIGVVFVLILGNRWTVEVLGGVEMVQGNFRGARVAAASWKRYVEWANNRLALVEQNKGVCMK